LLKIAGNKLSEEVLAKLSQVVLLTEKRMEPCAILGVKKVSMVWGQFVGNHVQADSPILELIA
jgi:hypothetical protein